MIELASRVKTRRHLTAVALVIASGRAASAQPCNTIATFADGLAPTREIHVAAAGSNTNGNGAPGAPYATIAFAATQALSLIHI